MTQTLFAALGSNQTTSDLYTVDPATGAMTSVGPIGFALTGLAFDPITDILYGLTSSNSGANPRSLISIDPVTGTGTLIGLTGAGSGFPITDLACDSAGNLYGLGQGRRLFSINKATGVATQIGSSGASFFFGGGCSFDSGDVLYASLDGLGPGGDLFTVDTSTGVDTSLGSFSGTPSTGGVAAASFDADDVLWGVQSDGATDWNLIQIDQATLVVSLIGAMTARTDALAWAPDTTSPKITMTPTAGNVGDVVSVDGVRFDSSAALTATFDGVPVTLSVTTSTDGSGAFTGATFTVPVASAGVHTIEFTSVGGAHDEAPFSVNPPNTDCSAAESLIGCAGTILYDNRDWDGTWTVGADPLFNALGEGGGAPGFYKWTNTRGRRMLFTVTISEPDDHATDYNFGIGIADDCASLIFDDDRAADYFNIAREFGNLSFIATADGFGPEFTTSFDIIVDPGHTVIFEIDSWTGDTSEPPVADPAHRGKFLMDWEALEYTAYDTTQGADGALATDTSTLLDSGFSPIPSGQIQPLATLILDDHLYLLWKSNEDFGDSIFGGDCALDGSGLNIQRVWDAHTSNPGFIADNGPPRLFTDGTDVFIGWGWGDLVGIPNPGYSDACGHHDPVFLCDECEDAAFQSRYSVYRFAGGGAWDLLYSIGGGGNDPAFAQFVPDVNGDVGIWNDSNISNFAVRGTASSDTPGKVLIHAAYTVVQCDQSLHFNDYPLFEAPPGSLWCTNDQIYVNEYIDTFEIDVATADPVGGGGWTLIERQSNLVGTLQTWNHDNPAIDPAFGVWQFFDDGDLVTDPDTPRTSIIYAGFDIKNDDGFPLVAGCSAVTLTPGSSGPTWTRTYDTHLVFRRIDTDTILGSWTYNDFTVGHVTSSNAYCTAVNLTYKFTEPDDLDVERGVATKWTGTGVTIGAWTDRIISDGSTAPKYIVAGDPFSSTQYSAILIPDTLVAGGRQWWAQDDISTETSFSHYDYCDTPGWRSTYDGHDGPDHLPGFYAISPRSAYDAVAEDFYFILANNQLRKAHVLRDYFICEPGSPCTAGMPVFRNVFRAGSADAPAAPAAGALSPVFDASMGFYSGAETDDAPASGAGANFGAAPFEA